MRRNSSSNGTVIETNNILIRVSKNVNQFDIPTISPIDAKIISDLLKHAAVIEESKEST